MEIPKIRNLNSKLSGGKMKSHVKLYQCYFCGEDIGIFPSHIAKAIIKIFSYPFLSISDSPNGVTLGAIISHKKGGPKAATPPTVLSS